jgi:hypothetical protein
MTKLSKVERMLLVAILAGILAQGPIKNTRAERWYLGVVRDLHDKLGGPRGVH